MRSLASVADGILFCGRDTPCPEWRGPRRLISGARRASNPAAHRIPDTECPDHVVGSLLSRVVIGCILAASCATAHAQQAFSVPKLSLRAFVHNDASLGLLYDITLQNGRAA